MVGSSVSRYCGNTIPTLKLHSISLYHTSILSRSMVLTTGQQAALFAIALILVGVGALGGADQLKAYGLPPISGLVIFVMGLIGTALIKAYGLGQQTSLKLKLTKPS